MRWFAALVWFLTALVAGWAYVCAWAMVVVCCWGSTFRLSEFESSLVGGLAILLMLVAWQIVHTYCRMRIYYRL